MWHRKQLGYILLELEYLVPIAGVIAALVLLAGLWFWLAPGPRLSRRLARARRLLRAGQWQSALSLLAGLQQQRLSARWDKKVKDTLAECHRSAAQEHLRDKQFEKAAEAQERAADLCGQERTPARAIVVTTMLEEVRRLFAASAEGDSGAVQDLIARTLLLDPKCAEAYFWQALCLLRDKKTEEAALILRRLVEGTDGISDWTFFSVPANPAERFIDPPLYLGAIRMAQGQPREALRYLTEANRIDGNCPVVTCLLGMAIIAAGGDVTFALRALQRPLGPRGFALWAGAPEKVWIEGFPEGRSYVRRLASKYPYQCPLWGRDYLALQRQGSIAFAEGYLKAGQFEQAVTLFERLVDESAPSATVLRGLGLALVRLGRYDQAFKHLRAAYELEEPKTALTAGYLALCGARGKPATPEDKVNNVNWALWLVRNFRIPGDAEWASLLSQVFAEARASGVSVEEADQLHLCDHLASVQATDADAAAAYHHLAETHPDAVRSEFAWLYCRAAQLHGHEGPQTLVLFARTFQEHEAARAYFAERSWDFGELEFAFLQRAAAREPGRFPETLGPDYPAAGAQLLLTRAESLQSAGNLQAASESLEVLVRLAPGHTQAMDHLAHLAFAQKDLDRALALLEQWHRAEPGLALPLARQAILHRQRGDQASATQCIRHALERSSGRERASLAFLGAQLALPVKPDATGDTWEESAALVQVCLEAQPEHADAAWLQAAIFCVRGDQEGLQRLAANMDRPEVDSPSYRFLAAICQLAAGNSAGVIQSCQLASADPALRPECDYLLGWEALQRRDVESAAGYFSRVAGRGNATAAQALALLGGIRFYQGQFDRAVEHWKALTAEARQRLHLQAPLANLVFLSALEAFRAGDFQKSAARIREAGKLGVKDRRLGPLLALALLRAGQKLLYPRTA